MKTFIRFIGVAIALAGLATSQADIGLVGARGLTTLSPTLEWNHIALETVAREKPDQHKAMRLLSYVSLAQYAALASSKDASGSHDAVATASMQVIAGLVPSQAAFVEKRYRERHAMTSERGRRTAQHVLAQARRDGFAATWSGRLPQTANTWRSLANPPAPPSYAAVGGMHTFLLKSGAMFRAALPPPPDSERFADDLAEVRRYTNAPTPETTRIARFYAMSTKTLVAGYWNERATELIRERGLNETQAARILATMNTAMMDAVVACHDSKYAYWVARPSQVDPSIKPLIGVPNHPSYPSNHACVSTAAARVLAHFFPQAQSDLEQVATEAALSRIYAGIHFRFDIEAGEKIGRKVAAVAIARHAEMLAKWTHPETSRHQSAKR